MKLYYRTNTETRSSSQKNDTKHQDQHNIKHNKIVLRKNYRLGFLFVIIKTFIKEIRLNINYYFLDFQWQIKKLFLWILVFA